MTPWQRDLIAVAGVLSIAFGMFLLHPALAFIVIGGALLKAWYHLVPPKKDEADDGSGHSS